MRMKRALAALAVWAITGPVALAAYNDVSLTTDAVLSVNGVTLNVSGSTAAIESITINATNFSVTLPSGSNFQVTAPNLNRLSADTLSGVSRDVCNSSQSVLGYAPSGATVTVTVAPSTVLCNSGGGGSTGGVSGMPAEPAVPATPAAGATPAVAATPAVPATPAARASGLSASQIQSILGVLASFNADAAVIAKVKASLEGTTTGSVTSVAVRVFKNNLTVGSLGSQVKALQEFLNARGFIVEASGPGSPGNETTRFGAATKAALIKYQKARGIAPASGYFGPKTRAQAESEP